MDREYREIDVEVELQFLRNDVMLSNRYGNKPIPRNKEVFSLSKVKGVDEIVETGILIEDKIALDIGLVSHDFVLHDVILEEKPYLKYIDCFHVPVLEQIFHYRRIDLLLGRREVVHY